ncbi:hypothetical protein ABK040_008222 [Willaertia magna]
MILNDSVENESKLSENINLPFIVFGNFKIDKKPNTTEDLILFNENLKIFNTFQNNIKEIFVTNFITFILTCNSKFYYFFNSEPILSIKEVYLINNFVKMSTGINHALLFTKDEQLYFFDINMLSTYNYLQLHSNLINPNIFIDPFYQLKSPLQNNEKILTVFCKNYNLAIITTNNDIYMFGKSILEQYQINFSFVKLPIKGNSITFGNEHCLILTTNNYIYSCGSNLYGQLGLGDFGKRKRFIRVENNKFLKNNLIIKIDCMSYTSFILTNKGDLLISGLYGVTEEKRITTFTKIVKDIVNFSTSSGHIIARNKIDEYLVMGKNGFKQLGLDDNLARNTFCKLKNFNTFFYNFVICGENITYFYHYLVDDKGLKEKLKKQLNRLYSFKDISIVIAE